MRFNVAVGLGLDRLAPPGREAPPNHANFTNLLLEFVRAGLEVLPYLDRRADPSDVERLRWEHETPHEVGRVLNLLGLNRIREAAEKRDRIRRRFAAHRGQHLLDEGL